VPVYVVITMRSDFIGNCTEFEGLTEAINEGQYLVPRMTRDERRSAIVGPVAVGGAEITPRLVLRLLNDVGDDPDQLPILQHALMRTWDYWEAHHAVRGVDRPQALRGHRHHDRGALAARRGGLPRARDARTPEIAEKMFKALTDRGSDARGVRPEALRGDLRAGGGRRGEAAAVVEASASPGEAS
jgi:hypothetical protein